ncbi:hypothetical protein E2C01_011407 [Portunus trituberculatus]|uniref:Uncharacterized protein n=1 Tax=Portunus trituberculatus TaxID=210409 RepID=A0A5B7DB45_PORTR|nr:hypothetical protein [Portunus trituberculatus]
MRVNKMWAVLSSHFSFLQRLEMFCCFGYLLKYCYGTNPLHCGPPLSLHPHAVGQGRPGRGHATLHLRKPHHTEARHRTYPRSPLKAASEETLPSKRLGGEPCPSPYCILTASWVGSMQPLPLVTP